MSYTNYRQMEQAIRERREFTGNSASGRWLDRSEYVVFSYGTLIASDDLMTGKRTLKSRRYSNTTSRLQNIVRRAWAGVEFVETEGRI